MFVKFTKKHDNFTYVTKFKKIIKIIHLYKHITYTFTTCSLFLKKDVLAVYFHLIIFSKKTLYLCSASVGN